MYRLCLDIAIGGKVADVFKTKSFRNGGSLAVRIPAGWLSEGEVTLSRDPISGEITLSQRAAQLRELLNELATREPVEDPVFEDALERELVLDDRSVFERQSNASN